MHLTPKQAEDNGITPLSNEENLDLYYRVCGGDRVACDQMIEGNMALVAYKVKTYLRQKPYMKPFRDELMSAGFLALTKTVTKLMGKTPVKQPNPTSYVGKAINRAIYSQADWEFNTFIPARSLRQARENGNPIEKPVVVPIHTANVHPVMADKQERMEKFRNLLLSICDTEDERTILELREYGYSDREIVEKLGLTVTTTYMMRRDLYRRYLEATGMKGEV